MKKNYFLFLVFTFFLIPLLTSSQNRYVSVSGSGSGSGTSVSNEWTLAQAFSNATAGMTVHVRKGNYGEQRLVLNNGGTSGNILKFIGYTNTPNDLTTIDGDGSTYVYTTGSLNGSIMPYLKETPPSGGRNEGTCINLNNKSYVHFENFNIEDFNSGLRTGNGGNVVLKNIVTHHQGNFNAADLAARPFDPAFNGGYNGWGIVIEGVNAKIINCVSIDAGAQGITIKNSDNWFANGNKVYAIEDINPLDYYFLIGENTTNGTALNTYVHRVSSLDHFGHGIVFKTPTNCTNNIVDGFEIINTNLELQFPGVFGNIVRNGKILDNLNENADASGINLANGSHSNHFENIYVKNRAVWFRDWADGLDGDVNISSYDNTFYNIAFDNPHFAVNFNHFQLPGMDPRVLIAGPANNNTFINCTWKSYNTMFQVSRPADNLKFINCVFEGGVLFKDQRNAAWPVQIIDDSYENCTFWGNSFTTPSGIAMQNVNPIFQSGSEQDGLISTNSILLNGGKATVYDANNTVIGITSFNSSATCNDGIQNGDETGVDCGGSDCAPCTNNNICSNPTPNESIVPAEISVSQHDGHGPCNLMDNDLNAESRWSANGDGQWAVFDLGSPQEFDQFKIAFYYGDQRSSFFDIQISDDPQVGWTNVITAEQSGGTSVALEDFPLASVQTARYIRYLGHGNSQANSDWNSLIEFKINKTTIDVTGVSITPENISLSVGETAALTSEVLPNNASDPTVSWESNDDNIATVDGNGQVTAIAIGTIVITTTTVDGGFTDTTNITVTGNNICANPSPSMSIQPAEILVSAHDGNGPCNMMDNSLNSTSRWSADGDGQWAQFDLGTSTEFDQLQIAFYLGDTRSTLFDIQVSNDATTWTSVAANQQSSGTSLALEDFNFPLQTAQYIRYVGHGNSQTNSLWNSLVEVKINKTRIDVTSVSITPENVDLNVTDTQTLSLEILPANASEQNVNWVSSHPSIATVDQNGLVTAVTQGTAIITAESVDDNNITGTTNVNVSNNICANPSPSMSIQPAEILVSAHDGNGPCNMMDNSLNSTSRWSADGDGQWAQFDLGTSTEFDQLQIAFYLGDTRSTLFDIQVSNDATTWTSVAANQQSSGTSLALEDFNFPLQTAQYIRYVGHGNSQTNSDWNSLIEFKINKTTIDVTGVSITPENISLSVGETAALTSEVLPNNASDPTVSWESNDDNIATVDGNGQVTAIAIGTIVITTTTVDGGFTDTTNITVTTNCPNDIPNEDLSVSLSAGFSTSWSGAKTIVGISDNTNNSDCALKLQKDATGDPWARFEIKVNLATNNLNTGDKIDVSLDANDSNGNARLIVVPNNNTSNRLIDHSYGQGQGWSSHSQEITVPSGASELRIWLYPNVGSSNTGYSLFDNLIVKKIVPIVCPDDIPNEDPSVTLEAGFPSAWSGAKTIVGVSDNTNNSDCALKLQKDATGDLWARYEIKVILTSNNLSAGDKIDVSLDANDSNGNARLIVVPNDNTSNRLIDHSYGQGQGWSSHSQEITVPSGASELRIWLYPNVGSSNTGYSLFDNLIVAKVNSGGSSKRVVSQAQNVLNNSKNDPVEILSVYPNPSRNEVHIDLPATLAYNDYSLFSINGALVKKGSITSGQTTISILIAGLEKGMYIMHLSDKNGNTKILKLMKEE